MLSTEQFSAIFPANKEASAWTAAINAIAPKYGFNTGMRLAALLAQCGHESEGFTALVENLNYSADALTRTWPTRFPAATAAEYARQPMRIANRAYADRMGNGPESSGDGWRYRGRGAIQITGKEMYRAFAKSAGKTPDEVVPYLETKEGAIESACWFCTKVKSLLPLADVGDIRRMTILINGGLNGLDDRIARYAKARSVLNV